jgi:hypothetical protein
MTTFFPCPSCHFCIQPPLKASANARLRCPVCQHELLAGDLLQGTGRNWVVIDDPGGDDLFFEFQPQQQLSLADQAPLRFESNLVEDDDQGELVLQETAEEKAANATAKGATVDWKKFKPITHEEFQRRKRATKPGWVTMLQILLGGAAAVPVSLLIIWHFLGKDIGGAGPMVGQYLPWVVPSKFRPAKEVPEAFWDKSKTPSKIERPSNLPRPGQSVEPPKQRPEIASVGEDELKEVQGKTEEVTGEQTTIDAKPEVVSDSSQDQSGQLDSSNQIASAIQDLTIKQLAWQSYQGDDRAEKRNLAQQFYKAICHVSSSLDASNAGTASNRIWFDKTESVCREVVKDSTLVSLIEQGAAATLRMPIESVDGLATIAEVREVTKDGDDYRVDFVNAMSQGGKAIQSLASPTAHREWIVGSRYLLLGRIVPAGASETSATNNSASEAVFRIGLAVRLP